MWIQLQAFHYPGQTAYQKTNQAFIDEWNSAIDMFGQVFSGITLVATTGNGFPNFVGATVTVPNGFSAYCTVNLDLDCAAETTILAHFIDSTVGGANAKATQTSGMAAARVGNGNLGVPGVKLLSQSTAQLTSASAQILGGSQFNTTYSIATLPEGCTSTFPPNANDMPAGCTLPSTCLTNGCIPVSCIPQACLAPGVTPAAIASFTTFSKVPANDLISPEQAAYNVLGVYFDGTPVASLFGGTPGSAPLNYLQIYSDDIQYATKNVNAPAPVVENSVVVSTTAQALLNLASQKILEIADNALLPFAAGGLSSSAGGATGSLSVTFPAGFVWSAVSNASWLTVTGPSTGTGSGTLTYQIAANTGSDRTATITIDGYTFTIEQEAASIPGLNFIGSMPHIAAEENWTTTFTLVNKGSSSATARLSLFGDPTGALTLPLAFPQQPAAPDPLLASTLDQTIAANASLVVDSAGPQTPPVQVGSAQLSATGAVDGFAIFHLIPGAQEAVVPMETRNATSYLLAYDNTGGVVLAMAVENVSAQAGNVGIVLRDDTGTQIGTGSLAIESNGHTSFVLPVQYTITSGKRGTIEFDTPAGGQISVLGIRTTPLGTSTTLTTIPPLANVGTTGGSIAHIATGNGWQTTFVLVNTGAGAAQINLNFYADVTGAPLSLPLSFPQLGGGSSTVASSVNQTLAAGASLLVQSAAPLSNPAPTVGSAQLTTNGNVGGFVIFRYNPNGQEAVVPMETRNASAYLLAFDNTAGTATGIAINTVSQQAVNIPVIVRDDTGAQIATDMLNLAANGHLAFTLVTDKYPAAANIRGTIEFAAPVGGQIGALGIRIPVAHTFTTLPALAK
jgi:hypothetical protein